MWTPRLRRTLASIALAAPLAPLAGCLGPSGECDPYDEQVLIAAPDAELAALVNTCRTQQSCVPLCLEVFERQNSWRPDETDVLECYLTVDGESSLDMVVYTIEAQCIGGRRPAQFRPRRAGGSALARYLTSQAELEAASVRAFADLYDDLRALNAPAWARRGVITAAADEVRHARVCGRLARRHGASPDLRPVAAAPRRDRRAVAVDNLVEGCVRETYGAAVAGYQARAAGDPAVRAAMRRIAGDEAMHAALSWRLHRWLWPQLSSREQGDALAAAARARVELDAPAENDAELQRVAGLPDERASRAMLAQLDAQVWDAI